MNLDLLLRGGTLNSLLYRFPGLPVRGATNPPGGATIQFFVKFSKNCTKSRTFWGVGGMRWGARLRSATEMHHWVGHMVGYPHTPNPGHETYHPTTRY